jgi:hypothetical protein
MRYWQEKTDKHIRLADTDVYKTYPVIARGLNKHGYVDAPLQPTEVLYMGTCDIMSSITDPDRRWCAQFHTALSGNAPLVSIGSSAAGFPTQIRRLLSFVKNYGPPATLMMTVARPDGLEYVNSRGECYNVNSRIGTPQFLNRRGMLLEQDYRDWCTQTSQFQGFQTAQQFRYTLEERFSFLETICLAYNIRLQWTFNLSDAAIVMLHRYLTELECVPPAMKSWINTPIGPWVLSRTTTCSASSRILSDGFGKTLSVRCRRTTSSSKNSSRAMTS